MTMNQNEHYDVVIVGGGLVGASLACALGEKNFSVAVIEAFPFKSQSQPSYDDRSVALAYGSKVIFSSMGLWSALEKRVCPIETIHVSDQGRFGFTRLHAQEEGTPALGYVAENRVLGEVFFGALAAMEHVHLYCPARFQSLKFEQEYASLTVETEGERRVLNASLVIAADGGRSAVRQAMGIDAQVSDYGQSAVIANVTPEKLHQNVAFERFTTSGPLALLPMTQQRCSVVWTVENHDLEDVMALSETAFLQQLQKQFGFRLGRLLRCGERAAYPLKLLKVDEIVRSRLAVIGNAAHSLHPVAGQGFNLGIRDVAALCEILENARNANKDLGSLDVLEHYAAWRRRDYWRITNLTDRMVRVFSTTFLPAVCIRKLGLAAVQASPILRQVLARHTMGLAGRLPRLARGIR